MSRFEPLEMTDEVRAGAAATFSYLSRAHEVLALQASSEVVDARSILSTLERSIEVTTVSLSAHQSLAVQAFAQFGEQRASKLFADVQNRRSVLQGFLAHRLVDQNATIEQSVRRLTEARTFKVAADAAGPLMDSLFYLHHVAEGETDQAILDAIGLGVGALAGAVAIAVGAPPFAVALVALSTSAGLGIANQHFDQSFSSLVEDLIELGASGFEAIGAPVFEYFSRASSWQPPRDPLVLDLNDDGIETRGSGGVQRVFFDSDGDGIRTATSWVGPRDGFLALDRNTNGSIDDGTELFGDATLLEDGRPASHGFEALQTLDDNADGRVDVSDQHYHGLRVWLDLNQDGISQTHELTPLVELGITSLMTATHGESLSLGKGVSSVYQGQFARADGSNGQVHSLTFDQQPFYSTFTQPKDTPALHADEVMLSGSGQVRDLASAATRSAPLAEMLEAYSGAATGQEQRALLDDLLVRWADTSPMQTLTERARDAGLTLEFQFEDVTLLASEHVYGGAQTSPVPNLDDKGLRRHQDTTPEQHQWIEKLEILERFNGIEFVHFPMSHEATSPVAEAGPVDVSTPSAVSSSVQIELSEPRLDLLEKSYQALRTSVYYGLVLQTRLKPLVDIVGVSFNDSGTVSMDFSFVEDAFRRRIDQDVVTGFVDLLEFSSSVESWNAAPFIAEVTAEHADALAAFESWPDDEVVFFTSTQRGANSNERGNFVMGGAFDDHLAGGAGDDTLLGGVGDDTLNGGIGSDVLVGGAGNDVLGSVHERGSATRVDGLNLGNDYYGGAGDDRLNGTNFDDTYRFKVGDGQDVLSDFGGHDVLLVGEGISSGDLTAERVATRDLFLTLGSQDDSILIERWYAGEGLDEVRFSDGTTLDRAQLLSLEPSVIVGTDANDSLQGMALAETVHGLAGDDRLSGLDGDDLIDGGSGDDILKGGKGNDSLFGGHGEDKLYGGMGSDSFDGGAGDDSLGSIRERGSGTFVDRRWVGNAYRGGTGNDRVIGTNLDDTYYFARGDGHDTIVEMNGSNDELRFEGDISREDLWFVRDARDLQVIVMGSHDGVTVRNWFAGRSRQVDRFTTAEGDLLQRTQVEQLVSAMSVFRTEAGLNAVWGAELREEVAPIIAASWQLSG